MKINNYRDSYGQFDSFGAKAKRFGAWVVRGGVMVVIIAVAMLIGGFVFSTSTVVANTVKLPVQSNVLNRIADCESGNGKENSAAHFDRNGQVVLRANTNGTVDIGKYQINSVWFKKATALGYDLTKENDNEAMAEWIYLNKGTQDWSASMKCWYK